ncbi:MAG: glycerophosphodiester phosphodiesterase family protein [Treponemataceae bacterium]
MTDNKTQQGIEGPRGTVYWQAHRGGGGVERPDNTMISARYGWELGGIPELDIRRTADGTMICLHDPTLKRTTSVPAHLADLHVTSLSWDVIRDLDAGNAFSPAYSGARVPLLEEVFAAMREAPSRRAYLDLKDIDLPSLAALIARYGVAERVYVSGPVRADLVEIKRLLPGVLSMQWCGGTEAAIEAKFEESAASGFEGLDQIQLHLNDGPAGGDWRYTVPPAFISAALRRCAEAGVDLEVLPWKFEDKDILALLELGLRWFVTDEPARFSAVVKAWQSGAKA